MKYIRSIVAAVIIATGSPAFAQETYVGRPVPSQSVGTYGWRYGYGGYYPGLHGRFMYGRPAYGWPVARPRVAWVVDDFVPEGRPLGLSANAYEYTSYVRPQGEWSGWPYATGGRDEEIKKDAAPKAEADAEIETGRAHWRAGDLPAALAAFKRAVAADLSSAAARLHMALALLPAADLKNADKALASAVDMPAFAEELANLEFATLFRNPKERAKFEGKLFPTADGSGTLTVAVAQHLLGMKAKAAALLGESKDPAAKRLAGALTGMK